MEQREDKSYTLYTPCPSGVSTVKERLGEVQEADTTGAGDMEGNERVRVYQGTVQNARI